MPRHRKQSATNPQKLKGEETRHEVLKLKRAGFTLSEIGARLGFSKQAAHKHLHKALAEFREKYHEDLRNLVELQKQRLEELWNRAYLQAIQGDLKAIETCRGLHADLAKLLGLNAPEKTMVATATQGGEQTLTEFYNELCEKSASGGDNGREPPGVSTAAGGVEPDDPNGKDDAA